VFAAGLEDLHEKRGSERRENSYGKYLEEGNPGAQGRRRGFYFVGQLQLEFTCRTMNQSASFCARSQKPREQFRKWLRTCRKKNTSVRV
jgi:hypothetical protein